MSVDQAPIGSITAFGGLMTGSAHMQTSGWLPCDGASYQAGDASSYHALFLVIGTSFGGGSGVFNVPDLQGRFLRGVNRDAGSSRDPDAAARTAPAPGGAVGNNVGSVQSWATGLPVTSFVVAANGAHTHQVDHVPTSTNDTAVATDFDSHNVCAQNSDTSTSDSQGAHTHTLSTGGDEETRPSNLNLNWFIKYQNTTS